MNRPEITDASSGYPAGSLETGRGSDDLSARGPSSGAGSTDTRETKGEEDDSQVSDRLEWQPDSSEDGRDLIVNIIPYVAHRPGTISRETPEPKAMALSGDAGFLHR